ncbi:MAG: hypothetical protein K2O18_04460 [Oscillospiraceae bacterium]|nr:hypothetical protein [Oscillospiraceae bacterium]
MKKNLKQLINDKKTLEQVAKSPDAQRLAGIITEGQDQASLQKIAEDAAKGDTAQLAQLIQKIVKNPSGAELLQRLNKTLEKQGK